VEHVLPQNPSNNSKWWDNFTEEEHEQLVHKMGNLVLLGRKKNSELNNKEFKEKKKRYFGDNIKAFPNSLKVMQYNEWTLETIQERQKEMLLKLKTHYKA
jgi:hypothetical protein